MFYHLFYIFISFWTKEQQQIDLAFEAIRADSLNLHFLVHFLCATQPRRAFALALSDSNLKKVFSLTRKKKLILEFSLIITRQLSYIKYLLASAQSPFWTWRIRWCMPISFMCCTKWHIDIYLEKYLMIYEIVQKNFFKQSNKIINDEKYSAINKYK